MQTIDNKIKSNWGVCAVCLPRECLHWIEDWVDHHIKCGASIITIYDNTGSTGSCRRSSVYHSGQYQKKGVSKRGEQYGRLTENFTDSQIRALFKRLSIKYGRGLEFISWQPRDPRTGEIVHGQVEAYVDFIRRHRERLDWAAFIDMDEYIYLRRGLSVGGILDTLAQQTPQVAMIQLRAWRFECRWADEGPKDINGLTSHLPLTWGGEKNLLRLCDVTHANIHWDWKIREGAHRAMAYPADMAFCHYNQLPDIIARDGCCTVSPRAFLRVSPSSQGCIRLERPIPYQGTEYAEPLPVD